MRPSSLCALAAILLLGAGTVAAQTAPKKITPVPRVTGPVPATADSRPFMPAADAQTSLNLPAYGYMEEEFFISGMANVYDWDSSGAVSVRTADAPYTTRILLRRPINPARFSGTVWVDMLNPARGYDFTENWGTANYYIMDHGDASIGITMFPATIRALKKFDPKRYSTMSMANPAAPLQACPQAGRDYDYEMEPGLRYDIVSQVGVLLKSNVPSRPLAGFKVEQIFLYGQTAGDMPAYISAIHQFANLQNGKPVWDGYFIKDGGGPASLNQCGERPPNGDPRRIIRNIGVPVIRLLVEDMVTGIYDGRRTDSDEPGDRYRLYEIPGATHSDGTSVFLWMPSLKILTAMNSEVVTPFWPFTFSCSPAVGLSDFPVHYFVSGAIHNLDEWVRNGTAPLKGDRIQVVNGGTPSATTVRDKFGNAVGGIRSPYLDVPAATYYEDFPNCRNMGYKIPFDWAKMQQLYGNYENYQSKFNAGIDRLVKERWIDSAYAPRMKAGLLLPPTTEKLIQEDTIETSAGDLKITSISHASLMFQQGGKVIHVDPVLNPTDDYYSKFPKANLILITHAHVDHLGSKAIEKLSTDKTAVIACPGCSSTLPKAHILANGEMGTFAGFKIEAVPAYNIVNKQPDGVAFHPKGDGDGFIITFGDKRIYIAGDTENIPEMKSFGRIDVAFLPMNLPYTMTPEMVADAVRSIQPAILYPYHYSTTNPLALVDLLQKEKSIEVRIHDLK
jgi:L-ascorbate metabolism protein UlaG (beta-lactamase superfamily)